MWIAEEMVSGIKLQSQKKGPWSLGERKQSNLEKKIWSDVV